MRLLSRRDGRLTLTEFIGRSSPPRYAILSHRWGKPSDEITFDDIEEGKYESKAAYRKVDFCLKQAESDGLEHCWIDTCCIRKADSTELSRSINSMFKWYEQAARCYVYLYDVAPDALSFKDSSWFTRGWTLQELLAPSIVEFFSSDGTLLGDRHSLLDEIHRRTRIPVEALRGAPLSEFSIEERLSWMKRRETTEEEDEAYSLLGIFGIHMSLIYGEGRVNALKRLREEVQKSSQTQNQSTSPSNKLDAHEGDVRCLRAWRLTDPRDDKRRILANKDPLLHGSCDWIAHDPAFTQWWQSENASVLWLHGDPGKGKTMLMMALTEQIAHHSPSGSNFVSFFFCQDTVQELSDITAVLRGLTFLLAAEHPRLRQHLRSKYEEAGEKLFEGFNVLHSMWDTLLNMSQDPSISKLYLLVDALDECNRQSVDTFFSLLGQAPLAISRKIKWVLSSRNLPYIREQIQALSVSQDTSLELNSSHVAKAVTSFIDVKINHLTAQKRYDDNLRSEVQKHLQDNADNTFLWVALACKELEKVPLRKTLKALRQLPPGLEPLYRRMLDQAGNQDDHDDSQLCLAILRTATVTYRPLLLKELGYLAGFIEELATDTQAVEELVELCGSFFTVRDRRVFFIHQSAKDFFVSGSGSRVLGDHKSIHDELTNRLISFMSRSLRTDVCGIKAPGVLLSEIESQLVVERLAPHVQYSCRYWGEHATEQQMLAGNIELIKSFMESKLLNWLEALSLTENLAYAVHTMTSLLKSLQSSQSLHQALRVLVEDTRRFTLRARPAIEQSPLQVYSSALMFTPTESVVRQLYIGQLPSWISLGSPIANHWDACLQTLGKSPDVGYHSPVFSPDGCTIAFISHENIVEVWDVATGSLHHTFKPNSGVVRSVAFNPDARTIAAGFDGNSVVLWDVAMRSTLLRLGSNSDVAWQVFLSKDGRIIASIHQDETLRLWNAVTGSHDFTFDVPYQRRNPAIFSPDGRMIAVKSNSNNRVLRYSLSIWGLASRSLLLTIEGISGGFRTAFSTDGQTIACPKSDTANVELWDISSGSLRCIIDSGKDEIVFLTFSPDDQMIGLGSNDGDVILIDVATRSRLATFTSHSFVQIEISFCPDRRTMVTAAEKGPVKLWDVEKAMRLTDDEASSPWFLGDGDYITFSPNGRFVAFADEDETILVDSITGQELLQKSNLHPNFYGVQVSVKYDACRDMWEDLPDEPRPEDEIRVDGNWICSMHQRLLWLPSDYSIVEYHIWGSKIAYISTSGRVVVLNFKLPLT